MFVDAFSFSQSNHGIHHLLLSPSEGFSFQQRQSRFPSERQISSSLPFSATSSESTSTSTTASITYDGKTDHHTIAIPSFLTDGNDASYPSLLHKIHVLPILTADETSHLLDLARTYATENQCWDQQDSSRHVSYNTVDFAIEESDDISSYLGKDGIQFQDRIFGALSDAYGIDADDFSFLDLFCASYEAANDEEDGADEFEEERNTMDRLEFHRDGSLLSFTVLLSSPDDFEGGGTIFDALRDVVIEGDDSIIQSPGSIKPPKAGYATLHSGKLLHGGHVVTQGQRVVLVGFVDVDERNVKEGTLGDATKEWGRNDVRLFWNKRRLELLKQQRKGEDEQPKWIMRNWRYLPKNECRSYFSPNSSIPESILERMEQRADMEKIRYRRLVTEDKLLREILLPKDDRKDREASYDEGEWTEVTGIDFDGLAVLGEEYDEEE